MIANYIEYIKLYPNMRQKAARSYRSQSREEQAAQTRFRILRAAKELFQSEGFDRTTIHKLAKKAEVSMPTVYALFQSKRGILQALIDNALPQRQFEALVESSMREPSPEACLKITARMAREIYDAERELMDLLRNASLVAPELKELEKTREERRYRRQKEYAEKLAEKGALAEGITLQKARDILWSLTGRDLYRMVVAERGWSSEEYEEWLAGLLTQSLLKPQNI